MPSKEFYEQARTNFGVLSRLICSDGTYCSQLAVALAVGRDEDGDLAISLKPACIGRCPLGDINLDEIALTSLKVAAKTTGLELEE